MYLQTEFIEKYNESVTYLKDVIEEGLPASVNLENDVTSLDVEGLCFTWFHLQSVYYIAFKIENNLDNFKVWHIITYNWLNFSIND